ncbi:hypothetical protein GCM10010365_21570 [Streptomyces poonensis]|uniref:Uncharacterized protein n=1 Tax=Streptomyces poonensis TaxID=68255 RepID=A0A918UG15_9ACTN|nr:hypothetical protein GCM10010365_21570 [Streptomyces poonensis]GLJ93221.1 hypothetical protein GCM10017589_58330 [Streptomyces poonensis]
MPLTVASGGRSPRCAWASEIDGKQPKGGLTGEMPHHAAVVVRHADAGCLKAAARVTFMAAVRSTPAPPSVSAYPRMTAIVRFRRGAMPGISHLRAPVCRAMKSGAFTAAPAAMDGGLGAQAPDHCLPERGHGRQETVCRGALAGEQVGHTSAAQQWTGPCAGGAVANVEACALDVPGPVKRAVPWGGGKE